MRTPFFGPAYTARSKNLADQRLINLYGDIVETKGGKEIGAFYMCPGLDLVATVGNGPIRGTRYLAHKNILIVVSGNNVYSLNTSNVATLIGTIGTSTGQVTIIDNAAQFALFDGVNGYSSSGTFLTPIALPFSGPVSGTYQDGFGLVNAVGTQIWMQSNLFDLSTWDGLNFTSADAQPDDVVALADIHREVWVLKQFDTEVWINAGLAGFAFQRLQGTFIEAGIAATYSVAKAGQSLIWLAQNREGEVSVVMTSNYTTNRISTFALEYEIAKYTKISDAIGMTYAQEGHLFYVLTFPTANVTWAYDVTASRIAGIPMWHQRASFGNGTFGRHNANTMTAFNGNIIVGDFLNGNLYKFNLDTATDNGVQRKWLRSWRANQKPPEDVQTFNSLRIDMETGAGDPVNTNPQLMLRWSDDGGHNWSNTTTVSAGRIGETARRAMFRRLGSTRRDSGLDRYFELSSTDQFKVALIGAELA